MGFKIPREGIGLLVTPMRKRQTEAFVSLGVSIGERLLNVLRDRFKIQFVLSCCAKNGLNARTRSSTACVGISSFITLVLRATGSVFYA